MGRISERSLGVLAAIGSGHDTARSIAVALDLRPTLVYAAIEDLKVRGLIARAGTRSNAGGKTLTVWRPKTEALT